MDEQRVLFSVDERVATITLNRPDKLNAFAGRMQWELADTIREATDDDNVRALIVTGAGRAFCAGADVAEMSRIVVEKDWKAVRAMMEIASTVVTLITSCRKPVIAAVNGVAVGGGANLVLACDLRLASERAALGQVFNRIGLQPDWGGTYFLPRLVGLGKAFELFFTADMIDANECLRIGLVNRVVAPEKLMDDARELAARLAAKPPIAIAMAKQAVHNSFQMSLPAALELELQNQLVCFKTEDAQEGFKAFVEKRPPVFRGV